MVIQDKPNQSVGTLEPGLWFRRPASPEHYKRIWISPRWDLDCLDLDPANAALSEPASIMSLRDLLPMKYFCWQHNQIIPQANPTSTSIEFTQHDKAPITGIMRRYVIFLQDWRSGHYFEIDSSPIVRWTAGETVLWQQPVHHVVANVGNTPLHVLTITGIIDPLDHSWRLQHFNDAIF